MKPVLIAAAATLAVGLLVCGGLIGAGIQSASKQPGRASGNGSTTAIEAKPTEPAVEAELDEAKVTESSPVTTPPNAETEPVESIPTEDREAYLAIVDALSKELGKRNLIVDVGGWRYRSWKFRSVYSDEAEAKFEVRGYVMYGTDEGDREVRWTCDLLHYENGRIRVKNLKLTFPKYGS